MRYLGIDYGGKRVGLALSDQLLKFATPLCVLQRQDEHAYKALVREIAEICASNEVDRVILGYPKNMDGTEGKMCRKVTEFRDRLAPKLGADIILVDERLSSMGAERTLTEAGFNGVEKRGLIDKMAAAYILQGYLDSLREKETINLNEKFENFENDDEFEEVETITLTGEDGEEMECIILDSVEYNGATYLLILDVEDEDNEDADAGIIKEVASDDESFTYEFIEDDDEFAAVAKLFSDGEDYTIK